MSAAPLTRRRDWQSRLDICVRARRRLPFRWGTHDCALFAADCVEAMTAVDLAADLRGTYETQSAAARLLAQRGGLEGLVEQLLGPACSTPRAARVGDVGIVDTPGGRSLAVCGGRHWLAPGESGLIVLGLDAADVAWRVG